MNPIEGAREWLWGIAARKVMKRIAQFIIVLAARWGVQKYGLDINEDALAIGLYGGLETLRNWLKVKKGLDWL